MKRKGLWRWFRTRRDAGPGRIGSRRQIVITAEKSETYIIRQEPPGKVRTWCVGCAEEIECLTVEQALMLTDLSAREVFRLAEAKGIHFCETDEGHLLICPNSVASFVRFPNP